MKIICPQCRFSRDIPDDRLPEGRVIAKCPRCSCRFHFSAQEGAGSILPAKGEESEEDIRVIASNAYNREAQRIENEREAVRKAREHDLLRNPWAEAPQPDGWLSAFVQTAMRVMFNAPLFFLALRPNVQIWRPLAFFIIVCCARTLIEYGWVSALYSYVASDPQLQEMFRLISPVASAPVFLLLLFRLGWQLFQLFLFAVLMYIVYRLVAPGRAVFMIVYQVLVYSSAPWLLSIVPFVGTLAGTLWSIGCLAVGCKSALGLTWPQTLAGFLPLIAITLPLFSQITGSLG